MTSQDRTIAIELAVGQWQKVDTGVSHVDQIAVSVQNGVLDVWRGEFPNPVGNPHWRFRAGQPVTWLPVTCHDRYIVTVLAVEKDVRASLTVKAR